jgi:hypothetical protein
MVMMMMMMMMIILFVNGKFLYECSSFRIMSAIKVEKVAK